MADLGESDDDLFGEDEVDKTVEMLKKKQDAKGDAKEEESSDDDDDAPRKKVLGKAKKKLLKKGAKKTDGKKKKDNESEEEDDDNFIDEDDDDKELVESYKQQKEFDSDDDPNEGSDESDEEGTSSAKRKALSEEKPEKELDPNSFQGIVAACKPKREKKKEKAELDEVARGIIFKMDEAVAKDDKLRSLRKPPVHKLGLLNEFAENLTHKEMQPSMLSAGALWTLVKWLRPSPIDDVLPALQIRTKLIDVLALLPISAEEENRWRDSKIGKLVNLLREHPKETQRNKAVLHTIMQNWAKILFQKKKPKELVEEEERTEKKRPSHGQSRHQNRRKRKLEGVSGDVLADLANSKGDPVKKKDNKPQFRAIIPQPMSFDFKIQPKDNKPENHVEDDTKTRQKSEVEKQLAQLRKKKNP